MTPPSGRMVGRRVHDKRLKPYLLKESSMLSSVLVQIDMYLCREQDIQSDGTKAELSSRMLHVERKFCITTTES